MTGRVHAGRCLCGGVTFATAAPLGDVIACHCSRCRRWSGHVWAGSFVARAGFRLTSDATLRWFHAIAGAFSVEAGCVSGNTGGRLSGHIFVASMGDYYDIADGLPQTSGR